jgi:hypothetical protein
MSGILYSKKIILLSNHKCASTSLDNVFSRFYDIRGRVNDGLQFDYNFNSNRHAYIENTPWKHARVEIWKKYLELKDMSSEEFVSVSTVRNPWDRLVSLFSYESVYKTKQEPRNFGDFVKKFTSNTKNYDYFLEYNVSLGGEKKVDHIFRVESLEKDLNQFLEQYKFGFEHAFDYKNNNTINASSRKNNYREYYNDETRKLVELYFKHEIDMFEYSF